MLDEISKALREQITERLASPLAGSFVIAWCLWNYKFLVILFSAASVSSTFELIDKVAFPDFATIALRGILFPAITAVAYIFLYPYPAKYVFGFTLRRQRENNELRQQIEKETLLSVEDSRLIRAAIVATEEKHRLELDKLNAEINRLHAQLDGEMNDSEGSAKGSSIDDFTPVVSSQLLLLRLLESGGGKMSEQAILSKAEGTKVHTEFDLGELVRMKLISKRYDQGMGDFAYEFTHEGRRTLIAGEVVQFGSKG